MSDDGVDGVEVEAYSHDEMRTLDTCCLCVGIWW